jgi:hypothetical protein
MRFRYASLMSILLSTACGNSSGGPGEQLLLGRFGDPVVFAELAAIHEGAELVVACQGYFSSPAAIELADDGSFRQRGRWYPQAWGNPPNEVDATISGQLSGDRVQVTLEFDDRDADPAVYDLRRDVSVNFGEIGCI